LQGELEFLRGDFAVPPVHTPAIIAAAVTAALVISACGSETPETFQNSAATRGAAERASRDDQASPPPLRSRSPAQQESAELPSYDGTLVAMVESAIAAEPELNTLDIDVTAAGGTVYLRGEARSPDTSRLATEVASEVDGVKQVQNELSVMERSR
jgi:hypothetical protein